MCGPFQFKVDVTTLKMARKPVKLQKESPVGCTREGKQSKGNYENMRRRKDRLKINRQLHFVRKKVSRVDSVR